jgi:hypothetical protein
MYFTVKVFGACNKSYGNQSLHVGHKRISKNKKNHDFDKLDHSSEMLI